MKSIHAEFFPPPGSGGRFGIGISIATAAHIVLILVLAWGIHWKSQAPEPMQAELWAVIPQIAAPPAKSPTEISSTRSTPIRPSPKESPRLIEKSPPSRRQPNTQELQDAQLAIEKKRREIESRTEKKRQESELEKLKAGEREREQAKEIEKKKAEERQQKEQLEKIETIRKKNLQRLLDQTDASSENSPGTAARNTGGISGNYAGKVRATVIPNIINIQNVAGNPTTEVKVTFAPDGRVISQVITKSSGVGEWDDAVLRAIDRTRIFPRREDGTMPAHLILSFSPKDL
ncbi:MAG: TonB family protein [Burkholderiales bacterium]